jgi:uncharacterized protein YciI
MAWLIVSDDDPARDELRRDEKLMAAHVAWEGSMRDRVLAAGSLRSDDGETPTGSLLILDVETREEAEVLFRADPFTQAGLRTNVQMRRWNRYILAGKVDD